MTPHISIVIPVYCEEGNIKELVSGVYDALSSVPWPWEMLLVDDGSTDGTAERIREEASRRSGIRGIFQPENQGQSAAFHRGFLEAGGTFVVTMDGDLQNDPADIPRMAGLAGANTAVCGIREKRRDSLVRRLSSRTAYLVRDAALHDGIVDTGCSLKVMPREHVLRIPYFRGVHRFYPAFLIALGVEWRQIPVNHRPRIHGVSKYGVINRAFSGLADIFRVRKLIRSLQRDAGGVTSHAMESDAASPPHH